MASSDSEDEIFFGPIGLKEQEKISRLHGRKTMLITKPGPLHCTEKQADVKNTADHLSTVDPELLVGSECESFNVAAKTLECRPRESLLTVQQVLQETTSAYGGVTCGTEVEVLDSNEQSQVIFMDDSKDVLLIKDKGDKRSECEELNNVATDKSGREMFKKRLMEEICLDGNKTDTECIGIVEAFIECTNKEPNSVNESSDRGDYDSMNKSEVSEKMTGRDIDVATMGNTEEPMLQGKDLFVEAAGTQHSLDIGTSHHTTVSEIKNFLPVADTDGHTIIAHERSTNMCAADFNEHPSPVLQYDYSYLSNRFSNISIASEIDDQNLNGIKDETVENAHFYLKKSKPAINFDNEAAKDVSDAINADSQYNIASAIVTNYEQDSIYSPVEVIHEPALPSQNSSHSLLSLSENHFVTPPPKMASRLVLKIPSFDTLTPEEVVTPPPTSMLKLPSGDMETNTSNIVPCVLSNDLVMPDAEVQDLFDDGTDMTINSAEMILNSKIIPDPAVTESGDDDSRRLDCSSLSMLADVALAEHEKSLVAEDITKQEMNSNDLSSSDVSELPNIDIPAIKISCDHDVVEPNCSKFKARYSPPVHYRSTTPVKQQSVTPCSPGREKNFLAFVRQLQDDGKVRRSPLKSAVRNMNAIFNDNGNFDYGHQIHKIKTCEVNNAVFVDESALLDDMKEDVANVVRAINDENCMQDVEISDLPCLSKPRFSVFSSLDIIDVNKPNIFGTFITEEEENKAMDSCDVGVCEGKVDTLVCSKAVLDTPVVRLEHGTKEVTAAIFSPESINVGCDRGRDVCVTDTYAPGEDEVCCPDYDIQGYYSEDHGTDLYHNMHHSYNDSSYSSDTEVKDAGGIMFNDTLEHMEMLLKASKKLKEQQLQQCQHEEEQLKYETNEEMHLPCVESNCDKSINYESTVAFLEENHLDEKLVQVDGKSVSVGSLSPCDVPITGSVKTSEGLPDCVSADSIGSLDLIYNYSVVSPKKNTKDSLASVVSNASFNPTMDSTHASCVRLTQDCPNHSMSVPNIPQVASDSLQIRKVVGNAETSDIFGCLGESACFVERDLDALPVTGSEKMVKLNGPAAPSAVKVTPVKPPRGAHVVRSELKTVPVAVVSPNVTPSSDKELDKPLSSLQPILNIKSFNDWIRADSHLLSTLNSKIPTLSKIPTMTVQQGAATKYNAEDTYTTTNSDQVPHFKTPARRTAMTGGISSSKHFSPNAVAAAITDHRVLHSNKRYLTPQQKPPVASKASSRFTKSASKSRVFGGGGLSGVSRVKQVAAVPYHPPNVASPVVRSILVNPPPQLMANVRPRFPISPHKLQGEERSLHAVPCDIMCSSVTPGKLAALQLDEDLNSSLQQRAVKFELIQQGLNRLTAKFPPSPGSGGSPSAPPSSPYKQPPTTTAPARSVLPYVRYYQQSSSVVTGDPNKENRPPRRPCCQQEAKQEGQFTPQVLRHAGHVLVPRHDSTKAPATTSSSSTVDASLMEVSVLECRSAMYSNTLGRHHPNNHQQQ